MIWSLSSPPPTHDPAAEMLTDLGTRLDPSWFILAMLVPVAIVVLWFGNRSFRQFRGASQLEPRGRPLAEWSDKGDAEWERSRARLEGSDPSAIANASSGMVRIEATIVNAAGSLGGPPGRECVWRNRVGGRPDSAVASEVIVVADDSGKCGVENLESARVTAPHEKHSIHHESIGLYVGDRVEILGRFVAERTGEDADPTQIVYGTIGARGRLVIRVLDRPEPAATDDADPDSDSDSQPEATS